MADNVVNCLLCGKPLVYHENAIQMKCSYCGKFFKSYVSCEDGHYICDSCHEKKGVDAAFEFSLHTESRNPIEILMQMMKLPEINMHGPEHHVMIGSALIAAYANSGGSCAKSEALKEMRARGSEYPGGSCGYWGCCGAAVSAGMFISIILSATPLKVKPWSLANEMTSRALAEIAKLGGPRCCKRNSFTAAVEAVKFVKEKLDVEMELPQQTVCTFSKYNRECKKTNCPYYLKVEQISQ